IRKKTSNRKGLQDALRAILNKGGDITEDWPIENAMKAGDDAVGVSVLLPLYEEWKDKPVHVDLPALWIDLGIVSGNGPLHYSEKAASARIRRAITEPQTITGDGAKARIESPVSVVAGRKVGEIS